MKVLISEAAVMEGVRRERMYAAVKQALLRPMPDLPCICVEIKEVLAFKEGEKSKRGLRRRATEVRTHPGRTELREEDDG
jgi:hypothetical protein